MIIDKLIERARNNKKTICLVETEDVRVLSAASKVKNEDFANIILVGEEDKINNIARDNNLNIDGIKIINPKESFFIFNL